MDVQQMSDISKASTSHCGWKLSFHIDELASVDRRSLTEHMDALADLGVRRFQLMMMISRRRERVWSYPSRTEYRIASQYTSDQLSKVFVHQFEMTGPLLGIIDESVRGSTEPARDMIACCDVQCIGHRNTRRITADVTSIIRIGCTPVEVRSV